MPIALESQALREYAGPYSDGTTQTVTLELREGALWLAANNGITFELVPTGKDEFFALGAGPVRFERGADGKVGTLVLGGTQRLTRAN